MAVERGGQLPERAFRKILTRRARLCRLPADRGTQGEPREHGACRIEGNKQIAERDQVPGRGVGRALLAMLAPQPPQGAGVGRTGQKRRAAAGAGALDPAPAVPELGPLAGQDVELGVPVQISGGIDHHDPRFGQHGGGLFHPRIE